jgi:SAM-dependent methyltransferase
MESFARRALAAAGLLRPAFRAREALRAVLAPRTPTIAPDGLPLPGRLHMVRVAGHANWEQFFESGRREAEILAGIARAAGSPLDAAATVLDWGCGCGRITRHLPRHTPARIVGRDPDPLAIRWDAAHLPGDYRRSRLEPPLDLTDASIDIAISVSVFTHLTDQLQKAWLAELNRVIRPGGLLLLTFMDPAHHRVGLLGSGEAELRDKGYVRTTDKLVGLNYMAAYQTREHLEAIARPWFDVRLSHTSAETRLDQAVLALQRR